MADQKPKKPRRPALANSKRKPRAGAYTPALAAEICKRIVAGKSLTQVCDTKGMPSSSQVYIWLSWGRKEPETYPHLKQFVEDYALACEIRADKILDEIIDIADDSRNDYIQKLENDQVVVILDAENIQRSRLRVDSRKWQLAHIQPKKYSDKLIHANDPENPLPAAELKIDYAELRRRLQGKVSSPDS